MRLGPLGLFDVFESDFQILSPNQSDTAALFRKYQLPRLNETDYRDVELRKGRLGDKSQTSRVPADFAVSPDRVVWSEYEIVISVNHAVPLKIRQEHPEIVWICMPGEGKIPYDSNGWDYYISHDCPASPVLNSRIIDMPYTFLSTKSLNYLNPGLEGERRGIYIEINSVEPSNRKDWLKYVPLAEKLNDIGYRLNYHPNNTEGHLQLLRKSRYFLKIGGRSVRGNGFMEAMSMGLICLMRPTDCFGGLMLPAYCYYSSDDELVQKLAELEQNSLLRQHLIDCQREILDNIVFAVSCQFSQALKAKEAKKKCYSNEKVFQARLKLAAKALIAKVTHKIISSFGLHGSHRSHIPPVYEL